MKVLEKKPLLKNLIYEEVNGKPIYYKNYKLVIKGKKTIEEVMASSSLQVRLKSELSYYLNKTLREKGYIVLVSEVGIKLRKGGSRSLDLAIYKFEDYEPYKNSSYYLPISPIVAIEIDIKAEIKKQNFMDYVIRKIEDLFEMETLKVIWIFTSPKIILVANKNGEWFIKNWEDEINVINDVNIKLKEILGGS
jgi:Uma2 family endonuclease